ncbi:MAG: oligopeptide:H+ symporter, partial [Opitutales bacterium]
GWLGHGGAPPAASGRPGGRRAAVAAGTAVLGLTLSATGSLRWTLPALCALTVAGAVWLGVVRQDAESRRMSAVLVFFLAATLFWAIFEQAGSTLTLFADELTRNEAFGVAFPSSWWQSVNSLMVMALAPVFAWAWVRLGERQPSVPAKFGLGLLLLGLSFALMVPAAHATATAEHGTYREVGPEWLLGVYLLQTLGEMCLSPVGLSTMTKLAPARLASMVMGVWFLATAIGSKLAGSIAGEFTAQPDAMADFFLGQALVVGAAAAAIFLLAPWIRRRMEGR